MDGGLMMKKIILNNKGFTLLELMVSMATLSFVVVGFLNMFVTSSGYSLMARQKSNTSASAQSIANEAICTKLFDSETTTSNKTLVINLTPTKSVSMNVTEITVVDSSGNQSSEIVAIIP